MDLLASAGDSPEERLRSSTNQLARRVTSPQSLRNSDEENFSKFEHTPGRADFKRYAAILRNRWRTIAGVAVMTVLGVAIGTFLQPPVYRATGMLEIRQQAADIASVDALFEPQRLSEQFLETQYGILRSPALARRVVLDAGAQEMRQFGGVERSLPSEAIERRIARFQKGLNVDPITGTSLVRVHFEADDPVEAAQGVNAVFKHYVALRVEAGRAAEQRLREQVDSVRSELARAEAKLQEYVRANGLVFLEDRDGGTENIAHERLRELQRQLTEAEAQRYEKESSFRTIQSEGDGYLASPVLQALTVRQAELQSEYAKLSSTFTDDYPRTQQIRKQLDDVEAALARERRRISRETRNSYVAASRRQEMLRDAFEAQKQALDALASRASEYHVLRRGVEGQQQLHTTLQQKQKAAGVSAALAATEVNVVDRPAVPEQPVRPVPRRNLQLALVAGLVLGIGLAFLRDYADPALSTAEEVTALSNVPVLGMIPSTTSSNSAALADAFGGLRTSILFDLSAAPTRSLLVTSGQPGDGKTTVCTNLAVSLAKMDRRVLLIDADIRRPAVHRTFHIDGRLGLSDYLTKQNAPAEVTHRDVVPGLDVITAGEPAGNPAELLSSGRMIELLKMAEAMYDFVLVDSPALLINAADARILASLTDSVVLVVRSGTTPRDSLSRMVQQVRNVIGVVVNDLDPRRFREYYRDYPPTNTMRAHEVA